MWILATFPLKFSRAFDTLVLVYMEAVLQRPCGLTNLSQNEWYLGIKFFVYKWWIWNQCVILYFKVRIYSTYLPNSFHFHFYLLKFSYSFEIFIMWFNICSHSQLYRDLLTTTHPPNFLSLIYFNPLRYISTTQISLDVCSSTEWWFTYQGLNFLRKLSFPLLAFNLTVNVGTVWPVLLSRLEIALTWTCAGLC